MQRDCWVPAGNNRYVAVARRGAALVGVGAEFKSADVASPDLCSGLWQLEAVCSIHPPHQQLHPGCLPGEHVLSPLCQPSIFKDLLCSTAVSKNVPRSLEWWERLLFLLSYFSDFSLALGNAASGSKLGL